MPVAEDLRRCAVGSRVLITVGARVLFDYDSTDLGMRNLAVISLRSLRFTGRRVAEVMDLTENYVATLYNRSLREGSAGVVRTSGRPVKLSAAQRAKATAWRAEGLSNSEIGRRLRVAHTTVARALAGSEIPTGDQLSIGDLTPDLTPGVEPEPSPEAEPERGVTAEPGTTPGRLAQAVVTSRYAGAMLAHAFYTRAGAGTVLATALANRAGQAGGGDRTHRYDDLAVLTGTSLAFLLGAGSVEQVKHVLREQAGPLAGIGALPELRTLRPRLAALAEAIDPLAVQRDLATAMLAADAPGMDLYFVDDHFVPYGGAKPAGKGWNNKRGRAEKGVGDTVVVDYRGRAVTFISGEPSALSKTLPTALAELRQVLGADARIMLGFDRGGAYASVFTTCRAQRVDWITYRRGTLTTTGTEPKRYFYAGVDGVAGQVLLADEQVELPEYGTCRQLTLFEGEPGAERPVLQVLTSDTTAPAAALLAWLRCRWRIENVLKDLICHCGMDWLCSSTADLIDDTRMIDNPARKKGRAGLKKANDALAAAERELAQLTCSDQPITVINRKLAAAQRRIDRAGSAVRAAEAALAPIPAKLPANQITGGAERAIFRTRRRALQMVLRLLAFNAELWLADHLNAYLRDPDEYRSLTRNLFHLAGTIAYGPEQITVTLDTPQSPKIARCLALLLDEINTSPPTMPGDPRPITYTITNS